MSHDKLAYMANQIGRFFDSQKKDAAVAGIEDHIMKFWDPRMRRQIVAQLSDSSVHLDAPVREAIERVGNRTPA
jgi:formate dehydrogenase subunit delta